jgi:hypothetical protein
MKYTYMKWCLPGKAMLNMHINVKRIEGMLSEQQTNQEPDEEEEEEDEHEEAITQKPTCNEAIEHLNALQCFVESISEVPQQNMEKPFGQWRNTFSTNRK